MNSSLFKLNSADFIKGLAVAVVTPVLAALLHAMQIPGFDFVTFNWSSLLAIGLSAGLGYLTKNLFTDNNGAILGFAIGPKKL